MRKNLLVRYFAKPASLSSKQAELSGGITTAGTHLNLSGGAVGGSGTVGQSMLTTQVPGGRLLSRGEMSLHEVQVYLDREGASDLVSELVMKSSLSPNVFMEAVHWVWLYWKVAIRSSSSESVHKVAIGRYERHLFQGVSRQSESVAS